MRNERFVLLVLAAIVLLISILACGLPEADTPQLPPPTVTPYVPATSPPQQTPQQPVDTPTEEMASPAATETLSPTDTPTPTLPPPPKATAKPTQAVSEGPLDFEEPRWVHAWQKKDDGGILVTVKVIIHGGAPPFDIYLDGGFHGRTSEREYLLDFPTAGCGQIVHAITVKSADNQEVSKDFWLGGDLLGWCD